MADREHVGDKNFWDLANLDDAMSRPVTEDDLEMLKGQWPSLELVAWRTADGDKDNPKFESFDIPDDSNGAPSYLAAKNSNWVIQYWVGSENYPTAMSSSSGANPYGEATKNSETDSGAGTSISQAFATALNMIEIAKNNDWPGVQILSGSETMQWAAWAAAETLGMPSCGYEASPEATAKAERVQAILNKQLLAAGAQARPTLGSGSTSSSDDNDE